MPLQRLHLENFRLFQDKTFTFSDGINLILGENGSGKTTVLEALNVVLTGNSFRAKETKECINSDKEFYNVSAKGIMKGKDLSLVVENNHNKRLLSKRMLGGIPIKKGELYFLQVVLAKNLNMIDGEPEIRRGFFNDLMFHVKPEIKKLHSAYQKALKQRNRSLKKRLSSSEVSTWSNELSTLGLKLSLEQYNFFKVFKEHTLKSIEKNIANGSFNYLDNLSVTFSKGWERSKKLEESLLESLERDMALGYTSKGPHRMDYTFTVTNKKASSNLSRGQLKILILLVFLSSMKLLKDLVDTEILLMIDDPVSYTHLTLPTKA